MALVAAGLLFLILSASTPDPWGFGPRGANLVLAATLSTVAAMITTRRPEASVGWVLGAAGVVAAVTGFGSEYRIFAVLASPGAPAGAVVAWIVEWVWPLLIGVLAVVLLLFPDDGLRSSRWRPLLWLTAGGMLMASTGNALAPGPLTEFPVVDNPLWSSEGSTLSRRMGFAGGVATAGMVVLMIASVAAGVVLVLRFRGARGKRRQQLKWMTFVGALAVGAFFFSVMWFLLGAPPAAVQWLTVCALSMIPVAIGLAVLKYRLYDIDRIVNRTIVYAVVTALLGTVYATTVLILGNLFGTVGGDVPSWAVAVATLAVAAAFQPARRHVQAVIDLRFDRRKYDATRTLGALVAQLRDELDADVVSAHLLSAARQTMQPTHISVWLRSPVHLNRPASEGDAGRRLARPERHISRTRWITSRMRQAHPSRSRKAPPRELHRSVLVVGDGARASGRTPRSFDGWAHLSRTSLRQPATHILDLVEQFAGDAIDPAWTAVPSCHWDLTTSEFEACLSPDATPQCREPREV